MTIVDFLKRLYDLPKDAKVVLNSGNFSEIEMKLFLVSNAPTAEKVFKTCIENINLFANNTRGRVCVDDFIVKDFIFHDDHFKRRRFYEITIEQDENRRTKN